MSKEYEGMGLSAEELAILAEPDDDTTATQEELEARAATTDTTTKPEEGHDDDERPETPAGADAGTAAAADPAPAAAAAEPEPAAAASASAPAEPGAAQSVASQQAPILVAQAPDDAEAKLKQISTDKVTLRQKYDDGELTFAEYEAQKETLDEQRMEIRLAVETAQTAQKMEHQRQQNQWNADCANFMTAHKATYDGEANAAAFADLDAAIKAIAVMPSSAGLNGQQILDRAHKAVMAARGTPVTEAKPAAKPEPRKPIPKPALPPDLGKLPAAGGNDPGEGKWANLDRLQDSDPAAFTAALEKMSPADRDSYLAA